VLSRIAEALFWIGRYVERADDTARILDVHLQVLLEDSWIDEDLACRSLLSVMGTDAPEGWVGRGKVVELLVDDEANPSSIVGALGAARHNARGARETVSSEMWQVLNTSWTVLPEVRQSSVSVHELLAWVHERAAMVAGVADATMSHDDCWHFLVLGRSLGSYVAVTLAAARPLAAVILATPFDSIAAVGEKRYPFLPIGMLVGGRYDSLAIAPSIHTRALFVLAGDDDVTPPEHGQALANAWGGPKSLYTLADTGHRGVEWREDYWRQVSRFLRTVVPAPSAQN